MTNLFPMQVLSDATQANFEAMQSITRSMFAAAERVAALNIELSQSAFELVAKTAGQAKGDGWEAMLAGKGDGLKPAVAYFRTAQEISTTAQSEITKVISTRAGEAASTVVALMENLEKSIPAVAGMASSMGNYAAARTKKAA